MIVGSGSSDSGGSSNIHITHNVSEQVLYIIRMSVLVAKFGHQTIDDECSQLGGVTVGARAVSSSWM